MTRPLALVSFAVFLITSHVALAKPKVALTAIDGDASGDVHDAVAEALEGKELSLISSRQVNRAVDKLGDVADLTEKDFKKLANELEADAIVLAKLDKVGKSRTLKFRLFVHKKMAKGFTVSFKDARSEKFRTMLHDKMVDKLGGAPDDSEDDRPARHRKPGDKLGDDDEDPLAAKGEKAGKVDRKARKGKEAREAAGDDEDQVRPRKGNPARTDDEDQVRPRKGTARADDDTAGDGKRTSEEPEDELPRKGSKKVAASSDDREDGEVEASVTATASPGKRSANRPAVRLDVGASVLQRTFRFNAVPNPAGPRSTSLKPVPGARVEAEAYPLAFSDPRSAAAGLGLGFEYDKTLALNLTSTAEGMTLKVPVKQSHYSIGARYRLAFGRSETSPSLTLGAGYGKRLFSPKIPSNAAEGIVTSIRRDTPATNYTILDPGATFRLPVTRAIALSLGGHGLLITDAGAIQTQASYGRATVFGVDADAALDVLLGDRFAVRFGFEFLQIGYTFKNVGTLANNVDGDPATPDVGGLADRSIGGSATLAVVY
ncbi:MAG TPA: hypothetical protein VFK02_30155 [Kofleriaceae bacterium]|nr:hypothetical protein [Kofleriaceae bacterium]